MRGANERLQSRGAMQYAQRRKAKRKNVEWQARVRWERGEERYLDSVLVKVFSMAGLYFEAEATLEPGTKLECSIDMPPEMAFGEGVVMHCVGEVVNVRPVPHSGTALGVGMRTDNFSFSESPGDKGFISSNS